VIISLSTLTLTQLVFLFPIACTDANLNTPSSKAREMSHDILTDEKSPTSDGGEVGGESAQARIDRIGRERPEKFKSVWAEVGFCFSIVMSQVLTVRISIPRHVSQIQADIKGRSTLFQASL